MGIKLHNLNLTGSRINIIWGKAELHQPSVILKLFLSSVLLQNHVSDKWKPIVEKKTWLHPQTVRISRGLTHSHGLPLKIQFLSRASLTSTFAPFRKRPTVATGYEKDRGSSSRSKQNRTTASHFLLCHIAKAFVFQWGGCNTSSSRPGTDQTETTEPADQSRVKADN